MASKQLLLVVLAIVAIALPAVARATEHVVGDDKGWTINFDYTAWAEGRDFRVGDTLVFKYPVGYHNVYKVSGPAFQTCNVLMAGNESVPLTSGNDVITLSTTGRKWYICGKADGKHCQSGQKLVITVQPQSCAPAPSPSMPAWQATPASHSSMSGSWGAPAPSPSSWIAKRFFKN